jgi:hypothetical protein
MQVEVLNIKGKKTGRTIELPDEIFGAEPNDHVIYLAVKQYRAAQRQIPFLLLKTSTSMLRKQKLLLICLEA